MSEKKFKEEVAAARSALGRASRQLPRSSREQRLYGARYFVELANKQCGFALDVIDGQPHDPDAT